MNAPPAPEAIVRPITLAIMALGGQGGGVLAEWCVRLGELAGYRAQYTSVAGVAQRTGSTIYYLEFFPEAAIARAGREPVLALMPVPGDVDVVIAAELMEAGRAMLRGLVTPDRTTLIASTHRVYAISEKSAPAEGRAPGAPVLEAAQAHSRRFVGFDMEATAQQGGSVISAALFGALAGSGALPIARGVFEEVIREGGKAVEANLRTFALAVTEATTPTEPSAPAIDPPPAAAPAPRDPAVAALLARIDGEIPFRARASAREGVRRLIDWQDVAQAGRYLDRLAALAKAEDEAGGSRQNHVLVDELARNLALWMSFEDVFRVADLKTRAERFTRIDGEMGAAPARLVTVTEFMHPRIDEVRDSLPEVLAQLLDGAPGRWLAPLFAKGRRIATTSLAGFLLLRLLAQGRRWRRRTRRYAREEAAIDGWLARIATTLPRNYALARELVRCQRLVKGYGDTHARGSDRFAALMARFDRDGQAPGYAARLAALRQAALADEEGTALARALAEDDALVSQG
ncbi:MAG: indolepyruvate oxidoreductase subunit beta family protein [Proteobacteria bacterium]|nr:indolepyruvate oxidoreductase subunit beta family protein [Pseudomonadota bacterium]